MTDTPGQNRPVASLADAREARKIAEQYAVNLVTFRHAIINPNPDVSDEWIQDMNSIEAADACLAINYQKGTTEIYGIHI